MIPSSPRPAMPFIWASLVLTVLLVVGMVIYYHLAVRPWIAEPPVADEELRRLWQPVVDGATVTVAAGGPAEHLVAAMNHLGELDTDRVEVAVEAWRKGERLSDAQRNALSDARDVAAELVAWYRADGGFDVQDPCTAGERFGDLDLYLLGRLALAIAGVVGNAPPREDTVLAVLHLARAMRRGAGFAHLWAGLQLAIHVVGASERWDLVGLLRDHPELAPAPSDVVRTVYADVYCVDSRKIERFFDILKKQGWKLEALKGRAAEAARDLPRSWIQPGPSLFRRERRMLRWFWGRLLDQAPRGDPDDLEGLADALRLPADRSALPRSFVVRAVAVDLSDEVRKSAARVAEYRRRVGP